MEQRTSNRSGDASAADVALAKADLAIRIQRLAEYRRLTRGDVAALLNLPQPDVADLFEGRLGTCSIDELVRMLTCLGDDIEITIRPRLQRTKRGAVRVLQAAAVERPEDFDPVRLGNSQRSSSNIVQASVRSKQADEEAEALNAKGLAIREDRRLLDKHAVEKMTSLDITTIYRKMSAGTFPQPVKIGRRRVAWRASDIIQWQEGLAVGTETLRWKTRRSRDGNRGRRTQDRDDRR
jgi:prophage regulatory protein